MSRDEPKYRNARQRAEEHKSGGGSTSIKIPEGMKLFKLEHEGKYKIEVLPYVVGEGNPFAEAGDKHYERTFYTHRGIGASESTYICPAQTADKKCPICEARQKMNRDPDGDEKLIKDLAYKERQLFLIIDHADVDAGIQLWDISYHLFGRKLDDTVKNLEEGDPAEMFFHPKKGRTLKLLVEEKHMGKNKFMSVENIGFLERADPDLVPEALAAIGDDLPCLDELLVILPYEELKAIFLQTDDDEDDRKKPKDADEDETPKKKKPAAEEEEDDEDVTRVIKKKNQAAEEEEEEEDPPAKKKKVVEEEEESDEDETPKKKKPAAEEEEEAEEKPKKKKPAPNEDWD